jgi:hypothetical protein
MACASYRGRFEQVSVSLKISTELFEAVSSIFELDASVAYHESHGPRTSYSRSGNLGVKIPDPVSGMERCIAGERTKLSPGSNVKTPFVTHSSEVWL